MKEYRVEYRLKTTYVDLEAESIEHALYLAQRFYGDSFFEEYVSEIVVLTEEDGVVYRAKPKESKSE